MSLLKSSSPLDYTILTPLVPFISLCALFEVGLIHSWGTLTLTDIDHVRILKSNVSPTPRKGESPAKVTQNMLAYMGIFKGNLFMIIFSQELPFHLETLHHF